MAHFFAVYKALEGKETVAGDVNGREAAKAVIRKAMDHYTDTFLGNTEPTDGRFNRFGGSSREGRTARPRDFKRNLILSSFLSEGETGTINHIKTTRQREV